MEFAILDGIWTKNGQTNDQPITGKQAGRLETLKALQL